LTGNASAWMVTGGVSE